ncbi:MAG TPA: glycosyltransferase family 4 protein, partial [bacterium]|nr:glycosyltransferase family 4 protein [bacterium]
SCEVLTSRARDTVTWANELPGGTETLDGVTVRRFDLVYSPPPPGKCPAPANLLVNPDSPDLTEFIARHRERYDCLVFAPYLFGPTTHGIAAAGGRSILVPCLHDEPGAYLPGVRELFRRAGAVFFNSEPEKAFAASLVPFDPERSPVVGLGVEPPATISGDGLRERHGIERPFVLYAGRRESGKGIPLLMEYFRIFRAHRRRDLLLALVGSGEVEIPPADREFVRDLGYLPEEEKWGAYAAAEVFCHPSTYESFSIVLLEAWAAGTPALVNGRCPVTLDHCRRSGGGLYFRDYFEFEQALLYLLERPETAGRMGAAGREYVRARYRWEPLLEKLEAALREFVDRRRGGGK